MKATTNSELAARRTQVIPRAIGNAHAIFCESAENSEIWDVEGRRYIDFCSGIAVLNTGHRHPRIMQAIAEQAGRFAHTCFQVVGYESYIALAERLCKLAPGPHPKKAFFMTTGAEAVENAVKIARAYTNRPGIIAFHGAFHGRTMFALAMTGKVAPYKIGFDPLPGEVYHAAYPSETDNISVEDAIRSIEAIFRHQADPSRIAAIFVEPVQGEGGYIPAPKAFLLRLRELCDAHGILLVADEIQSGIARTGKMFALEHASVVPDLMTLAKGLGGGMTLSAVLGRADVLDAVPPGGLGSTYAGHPMACVAALAVLDAIEEERLCERSADLGDRMRAALWRLKETVPQIADVRGLGAMTGFALCHGGDAGRPAPGLASRLKAEAAERGLLLLTCGPHGNVVRIMTPLTISDALLDEGLGIIADILTECAASPDWQ